MAELNDELDGLDETTGEVLDPSGSEAAPEPEAASRQEGSPQLTIVEQESAELRALGIVLPTLVNVTDFDWPTLEPFVVKLAHDTERTVESWCPSWWRHPEAIMVFHALHQAFEAKRIKELDSWLLHDLEPQMRYLGSKEGPFGACSPKQHLYKNAKGDVAAPYTPQRTIELTGYKTGAPLTKDVDKA